MNYNPYGYIMPYTNTMAKTGLFRGLFKNLNLGTILTNTGKTLNIVNQTIPIIKQVSPIVKNAKSMFKIMNEFKRVDEVPKVATKSKPIEKIEIKDDRNIDFSGKPVFFV